MFAGWLTSDSLAVFERPNPGASYTHTPTSPPPSLARSPGPSYLRFLSGVHAGGLAVLCFRTTPWPSPFLTPGALLLFRERIALLRFVHKKSPLATADATAV